MNVQPMMTLSQRRPLGIGSVGFLNARPLVHGLEADRDVQLRFDVPSRLLSGLRAGEFDVALLPVIDYQAMADLVILPAGAIGSDGPTLTVRIFSRVPVHQIETLACDTDSHTSVALARIVLSRLYRLRPECVPLTADRDDAPAKLLIGDKVVCEEPAGYPHQLDLGAGWKQLTGLPFVFAVWTARQGVDLAEADRRLRDAKARGLQNVDEIIDRYAVPMGWPPHLARQYLTENLHYDVGEGQLRAMEAFYRLAAEEGIIDAPRPLQVWTPSAVQ